jgi:hypothetical protein
MRIGTAALGETDRLTSKELPDLDPDEWIEIRRVRDFLLDTEAELDAWDEARHEAEERGAEPPTRISQGRVLRWQFEHMVTDWNLYEPEADARRDIVPKTAQKREQVFRLHGVYLTAQLLLRGGATAGPPVKETTPQGEAPSFQGGTDPGPAGGVPDPRPARRVGRAAPRPGGEGVAGSAA